MKAVISDTRETNDNIFDGLSYLFRSSNNLGMISQTKIQEMGWSKTGSKEKDQNVFKFLV